jgi:flagellar biosynthesis/type III secretory pathway protein FliH
MRESFVAEAQASLQALADARTATIEACKAELAELAIAIAEAVLQREIGDGKATLAALLQQALVEMDPHERCTISVGADAVADITAWAQTRWPAAVVRADPALRPGELRIDAPTGRIDVNHAKRLERARRLVLGDGEP